MRCLVHITTLMRVRHVSNTGQVTARNRHPYAAWHDSTNRIVVK
jgi:hypothetical protein